MRLRLIKESMIQKLRDALKDVRHDGQRDAIQVWWHPRLKKVFMSGGDWVDSGVVKDWVDAVKNVVRTDKVDYEPESGPSGTGWEQVRDTRRLRDTFAGMSQDRRDMVGEGVVAAARGDIIEIVNGLASRIAHTAELVLHRDRRIAYLLGISRPEAEFSEEEDAPAVITFTIGKSEPQAVSIIIYGDGGGEIKFEMTDKLSKLLNIARMSALSSEEEVNRKLGILMASISDRVRHSAGG